MRSDLVVIGGGPAGMAAAATALAGGLRVTLLDSGRTLGGQYWRHPAPGSVPTGDHLHHDLTTYRALVDVLDAHRVAGTLDLLLSHHVWTAVADEDGFAVHVLDRSGTAGSEVAEVIRGRQLVIATGAFDRQLPFPGWDLPGVFTAGGLQALLKGNGVAAGSRVVVAGTGPFLLPVATAVADSGARVLAVCEANSPTRWGRRVGAVVRSPAKAIEGAGYAVALARHRIPVRTSTVVVAAHGQARLEAVTLAAVDGVGRVRPGTERRVVVDALGVGWGFVPQLDLAITLGCRLLEWVDGNHVAEVDAGQRSSVALPLPCARGNWPARACWRTPVDLLRRHRPDWCRCGERWSGCERLRGPWLRPTRCRRRGRPGCRTTPLPVAVRRCPRAGFAPPWRRARRPPGRSSS